MQHGKVTIKRLQTELHPKKMALRMETLSPGCVCGCPEMWRSTECCHTMSQQLFFRDLNIMLNRILFRIPKTGIVLAMINLTYATAEFRNLTNNNDVNTVHHSKNYMNVNYVKCSSKLKMTTFRVRCKKIFKKEMLKITNEMLKS